MGTALTSPLNSGEKRHKLFAGGLRWRLTWILAWAWVSTGSVAWASDTWESVGPDGVIHEGQTTIPSSNEPPADSKDTGGTGSNVVDVESQDPGGTGGDGFNVTPDPGGGANNGGQTTIPVSNEPPADSKDTGGTGSNVVDVESQGPGGTGGDDFNVTPDSAGGVNNGDTGSPEGETNGNSGDSNNGVEAIAPGNTGFAGVEGFSEVNLTPVPTLSPWALSLLGLGLAWLGGRRKRRAHP